MTVATLEEKVSSAERSGRPILEDFHTKSFIGLTADAVKRFLEFSKDYVEVTIEQLEKSLKDYVNAMTEQLVEATKYCVNATPEQLVEAMIKQRKKSLKQKPTTQNSNSHELPITLYDACNINREYIIDALLVPLRNQNIHVPNSSIRKHSSKFFSRINDDTSIFDLYIKLFEFQAKLYEDVSTSIENGFGNEEGIKTGEYQARDPVKCKAEDFLQVPLEIIKEIVDVTKESVDCASPNNEKPYTETFAMDRKMHNLQEMFHGKRRSGRAAFAMTTLTPFSMTALASMSPIVMPAPAHANEKRFVVIDKVKNPSEVSSTTYAEISVSGGLEKTLRNNGVSPSIADTLRGMQKKYFPLRERDTIIAKHERGEHTSQTFNIDGTYEGQKLFIPKEILDRTATSRFIPYSIIVRKLFSDGTEQYVRHVLDLGGNSYKRIEGKRKNVAKSSTRALDEGARRVVFGAIVNGVLKGSGLPQKVLDEITRKDYQSNEGSNPEENYSSDQVQESNSSPQETAEEKTGKGDYSISDVVNERESFPRPSEEETLHSEKRSNEMNLSSADLQIYGKGEQKEADIRLLDSKIDWMQSKENDLGILALKDLPAYDNASLKAMRALQGTQKERRDYVQQLRVATQAETPNSQQTLETAIRSMYDRSLAGASGKAVNVNTEAEKLAEIIRQNYEIEKQGVLSYKLGAPSLESRIVVAENNKQYEAGRQELFSHQLKIAGMDSLINVSDIKKYQAKAERARKNLTDYRQNYTELARQKLDKYGEIKQELDQYRTAHYDIWSKEELTPEDETTKSELESKIESTSKELKKYRLQRFNYAALNDDKKARIVEIYNNKSIKTIREVMEEVKLELGFEKMSRSSLYKVIKDAKEDGIAVTPRRTDKLPEKTVWDTIAKYYGTKPEIIREIDQRCKEYDVPFYLVLPLAYHESGFNNDARSLAGAIGIGQFMPGTAAAVGINPYDWKDNVKGMVIHLKTLLKGFNYQVHLTYAAYNAGAGAVKKYGGIPPYPETMNYVPTLIEEMKKIKTHVYRTQQKFDNKEF